MKKKTMLMSLAGVVIVATLSATTLAYVQYAPGATDTAMTTNVLSVELNESHVNPLSGKAMPGDMFEQSFFATNTGGYTAYISITLDKYWTADPQGGVAGKAAKIAQDTDASYLTYVSGGSDLPSTIGASETSDWIFVNEDENGEQIVAYYKKPVAPGEQTSNVIDAIKVANIESVEQNVYNKLSVQIDAYASAVQQIGDIQAISDEWGVTATIDANGNLTSIR